MDSQRQEEKQGKIASSEVGNVPTVIHFEMQTDEIEIPKKFFS
jgi:hypothetical protein